MLRNCITTEFLNKYPGFLVFLFLPFECVLGIGTNWTLAVSLGPQKSQMFCFSITAAVQLNRNVVIFATDTGCQQMLPLGSSLRDLFRLPAVLGSVPQVSVLLHNQLIII